MVAIDAAYARLRALLAEIRHVADARSLLEWDMETLMPSGAADERAAIVGCLSSIEHGKLTSVEFGDVLAAAGEAAASGALDERDAIVVRRVRRQFDRSSRLDGAFVRELKELTAASHHVWVKARERADFGLFLPNLARIVAMKREEARLVGNGGPPYDALLEEYEEGMTGVRSAQVLGALAGPLADLIRRVGAASIGPDPASVRAAAPLDAQARLNRRLASAIGFDLSAGVIAESAHPFMSRMHPSDVRLATAYREDDVLNAVYSTIHEAGHGLYEQGLPRDHYATPVGEAASYGLHESQSRLWENLVGRSRGFCRSLHAMLAQEGVAFPADPEGLYRGVNAVTPSLVRIDADEVTYNLHVCVRFEIERDLIEGRLDPADAPLVWNGLYEKYLGVRPRNDAEGVLQDVHWSAGLFGYFPSYAFGNLYAAQLYEAAARDIPGLEDGFIHGEFRPLLDWLRTRVHSVGGSRPAEDIVRDATGNGLDAASFLRYVERKCVDVYGI